MESHTPLRAARESVLLRVDYKSSEALGLSYLTNLSSGGLFLRTEATIPVGTQLKLVINFPEVVPPLTVDAEVRWTGTELQSLAKGVGLAFRNVSPEIKSRLGQIVASLQPTNSPLSDEATAPNESVPLGRGIRIVLVAASEVIAAVFRQRINRIGRERGWVVDLVLVKSIDQLAAPLSERRARMFIVDQDAVTVPAVVKMIRSDARHARTPIVIVGKASVAEERHSIETLYLRKPISMKPLLGIIGLVGGQHGGGQV